MNRRGFFVRAAALLAALLGVKAAPAAVDTDSRLMKFRIVTCGACHGDKEWRSRATWLHAVTGQPTFHDSLCCHCYGSGQVVRVPAGAVYNRDGELAAYWADCRQCGGSH